MKRVILLGFVLCCSISVAASQELVLEPFGVSPRDVEADTVGVPAPRTYLGILDRAYDGLLNVGVETKMYFKGSKDSTLVSTSWDVTGPTGSTADVSAAAAIDSASEVVSFIPDSAGTYTIVFTDESVSDTLIVTAGTYVGIAAGNCATCHASATADWEETGHYSIFEDGMNGIASSHYGPTCISCHTTGYDANADNDGFDDRIQTVAYLSKDTTFVFPDSTTLVDVYGDVSGGHLFDGVYDSLLIFFPNSMKLARIQCESCHGPQSTHQKASSLSTDGCAICHDSGTHHVYPEQWDASGHAHVPSYPGGARTNCEGCHSGNQFIQFVKGETITSQPTTDITCAVCHEPHDDTNEHQLRTVSATLASGETVTGAGSGALCMNCHHQRRDDVIEYTTAPVNSTHFGPHYAPQADMLMATNVITFGQVLPTSPHLAATENACVDCHMYPGHADEDDNVIMMGSHTFSMSSDTVDNVVTCAPCHGDVGDSFADKPFYLSGVTDHDGDGVAEGLQDEVHGLLDTLAALLPHADTVAGYDAHDPVDSTWTTLQLQSAFNYQMVYHDHSFGIHNPAFTVATLKTSIAALRGTLSIDGDEEIVPLEYTLAQNYPNPFNPTTTINFSLKAAGDVTLIVYNTLGREVMRIIDQSLAAGKHSVALDARRLASGVYFYRIRVNEFSAMRKMLVMK
ncbi:MAG: T9SS type A sorting domain-containing protein [Fidelibacterota bacterium]|nr:MAG: T9SS type A sorting domain-containing protein [Candidatus Neomarinimicrobiota bacterium]